MQHKSLLYHATQEPPVPHCNNHEIEAVAKEEKGHQPLRLKWPEIYFHVKTKTSSAWLDNLFRSSPTPETLLQIQSQGTIFEQHRPWKPGGVHASTATRILHGICVRAKCKRELSPIDRQPSSKQNRIRFPQLCKSRFWPVDSPASFAKQTLVYVWSLCISMLCVYI